MLTAMGVRAVITDPRDWDQELPLKAGSNVIRGLAWSMGRIERVEISVDEGHSWQEVHLEEPRERWLWVRWSLGCRPGRHVLMARAFDEAGRTNGRSPGTSCARTSTGSSRSR